MGRADGATQTSADLLASHVVAELLKISRLFMLGSRLPNKAGRSRLGLTSSRILACLLGRHGHPITLSGLADDMVLSRAAASGAVKGLEAKGLVRKIRSRGDARVVHLLLSATGQRKAEQAAAERNQLSAVIEQLTPAEQQLVLRVLADIGESLKIGRRSD